MSRYLSFKALLLMEGQKVIVHDLAIDCYDQICEVTILKKNRNGKFIIYGLCLKNEEFIFKYDMKENCINGDFEVYALRK